MTDQLLRTSGYALHITSHHLKSKIIQSSMKKDYPSIFHFTGKYLALAPLPLSVIEGSSLK